MYCDAENGVKLQLKFSDQIKIRMKQKQSRNGVGDKIKMKENLLGKNKNEIQAWEPVVN